jgi:pyrroline-5-carboxylate reductase
VLKSKIIGFIGGGNMAEAMIRGLVSTSVVDSKNIFVSDPVNEKLAISRSMR